MGVLRDAVVSKSFKREVAVVALLFWVVLSYRVFWHPDVRFIEALAAPYGTVSTTVWLYVAAAFGMDALIKSMPMPQQAASPMTARMSQSTSTVVVKTGPAQGEASPTPPPGYAE